MLVLANVLGMHPAIASRRSVAEVVQDLRVTFCSPISFIDRRGGEVVEIDVLGPDVESVLATIARQTGTYSYEKVNGRSVLYPSDGVFQRKVAWTGARAVSRVDAADAYVLFLRNNGIFRELLLTPIVGNPNASVYSEKISIRGQGRIVDQLIDLLGDDAELYLELPQAPSGRPFIRFRRLDCRRKLELFNGVRDPQLPSPFAPHAFGASSFAGVSEPLVR